MSRPLKLDEKGLTAAFESIVRRSANDIAKLTKKFLRMDGASRSKPVLSFNKLVSGRLIDVSSNQARAILETPRVKICLLSLRAGLRVVVI
jgi:hypothetical protein